MRRHARALVVAGLGLVGLWGTGGAVRAATSVGDKAPAATPAAKATPASLGFQGDALVLTRGQETQRVKLPCHPVGQPLVYQTRAYVACGADGVVTVQVKPTLAVLGRRVVDGVVRGLFLAGGTVWARTERVEARPVTALPSAGVVGVATRLAPEAGLGAAPPKEGTPSGAAGSAEVSARGTSAQRAEMAAADQDAVPVVAIGAGYVDIAGGRDHGLARGGHVELFTESDLDLGGGQKATRERRVAVGRLAAVSEHRARVELGLGERIPQGAKARWVALPLTASMWTPRRLGGMWELRAALRPFLALDTKGVGFVNDLSATYRFDAPAAIHLMLEPAGFGIAAKGNVLALAGNVVGAYDTDFFGIGLGLGWSAVNGDVVARSDASVAPAGSSPTAYALKRVKDGLSIAQYARLGAVDGLRLTVFNTFLLYEDRFHYGGTRVTFQTPVAERLWVMVSGGGGQAGYTFGEVGLRVQVLGSGDHGTIFVTPTLGGGALSGQTERDCYDWETPGADGKCIKDVSYGGPMVGIGVEWRL